MNTEFQSNQNESVYQRKQSLMSFYSHLLHYVSVISVLLLINLVTSPGYLWAFWPALGWGIGIMSHAFKVYRVPEKLFERHLEKEQKYHW